MQVVRAKIMLVRVTMRIAFVLAIVSIALEVNYDKIC